MPGDTQYIRNLRFEPSASAVANGFSSTGYQQIFFDGLQLGSGGGSLWTENGTDIYYNNGNVGIQNTNPQHAFTVGSPSNLYVDTTTSKLHLIKKPATGDVHPILTRRGDTGEITQSFFTPIDLYNVSINNQEAVIQNQSDIADLFNRGLQEVTNIGKTTTNNIGIQNTNPQHALSLGSLAQMNFEDEIDILCSNSSATVRIGHFDNNSGNDCISIGNFSGLSQGNGSIALGVRAANVDGGSQGDNAISIGNRAIRESGQGADSIAIGTFCAYEGQEPNSIAIGNRCCRGIPNKGQQTQNSVAIGTFAGYHTGNLNSISIGLNTDAVENCITIGTRARLEIPGSIFLNANTSSGGIQTITGTTPGLYINPIRGVAHGLGVGVLKYDPLTYEVTYSTT